MTMLCFFAISCISFVVGPSGIFSTESYQRGFCSAQKYGPVKISWKQRIWTPCRAASSIIFRCFSMLASRMVSSFSSVPQACFAWMRPHFTILVIVWLQWWWLPDGSWRPANYYAIRVENNLNAKVAKEREELQLRKALTQRTQRVTAEDAEECKNGHGDCHGYCELQLIWGGTALGVQWQVRWDDPSTRTPLQAFALASPLRPLAVPPRPLR